MLEAELKRPSLYDVALQRLSAIRTVPGRMERFDLGEGRPMAVVDYAHTDDALDKALAALRPLTKGRLVVLFGCGGDRDRAKRPLMAEAVAQIPEPPTHIFLQAGVGGLAGACAMACIACPRQGGGHFA